MKDLEPLRSSVGKPADGERNYFPRDKIVRKILRKLENGENLLLSAPRRIGKSTILKHIESNHDKSMIVKYIIVQSVNTQEEYFKKLFNELIEDNEIFSGIQGYLQQASSTVKGYASRVTGLGISGSVQLGEEKIDYYKECQDLIESFKTEKQIVIFVDEFPDALNNIFEADEQKAINFLQKNRDLRIKYSGKGINFVYTGSTGLKNVVRKFKKLDLINDIKTIAVPPFDDIEARTLINRLVLGCQSYIPEFTINSDTIEYILQRITWKLPYYIQIIIEGLFEYYEDTEKVISNDTVDYILKEIVKSKSSHADYFENWKDRLSKAFKKQDYTFAIDVLNYISKNEVITYEVFCDMAVKNDVKDEKYILSVLEHDGYISEDDKQYGFNSILLKEWWYINVAT